jgi:hypothetical protein
MKFVRLIFLVVACLSVGPGFQASAQIEGVTRKAMTIHKRPMNRVPNLSIVDGSIRLEDGNQNGALDADEQATLFFTLDNASSASGEAQDVLCEIRVEGTSFGITVPEQMRLGNLPIGSAMEVSLPIRTEMNTKDGEITLAIKIQDRFGIGVRETPVVLDTRGFRPPEVAVVDHRVKQDVIERRSVFDYEFMVQNKGDGFAYDVRCEIELVDQGVHPVSQHTFKFERLAPGEFRELEVSLTIQDDYPHDEVRFNVLLRESFGRYAETYVESLPIEAPLEQVYKPMPSSSPVGHGNAMAFFGSDVDQNIPDLKKKFDNRFALVIGNQDYTTLNSGLNATQDVPYAAADAQVMKTYFERLWGIPKDNIILELNATKVTMERAVARLANYAGAMEGEAELFFYYSGHGLPSEQTSEPFLIPVDVNGDDAEFGLSLEDVYVKLGEHPTLRTTVFLDACFSGGARSGTLIAGMKGLTRVPEEVEAGGRTVVFASSSGKQSSGVFEEQEHGYFTYFLLKYMQQAKGKLNYGEMFDEVRREVSLQSNRDERKQEPSIRVAPAVIDEWRNWGWDD